MFMYKIVNTVTITAIPSSDLIYSGMILLFLLFVIVNSSGVDHLPPVEEDGKGKNRCG